MDIFIIFMLIGSFSSIHTGNYSLIQLVLHITHLWGIQTVSENNLVRRFCSLSVFRLLNVKTFFSFTKPYSYDFQLRSKWDIENNLISAYVYERTALFRIEESLPSSSFFEPLLSSNPKLLSVQLWW